jgi:hypothetical protein
MGSKEVFLQVMGKLEERRASHFRNGMESNEAKSRTGT